MPELLLLTLIIVLIAVLLLGIRVFFFKNGKFPNTHIDGNKALRQKGIRCAAHQDSIDRKKNKINSYEKN